MTEIIPTSSITSAEMQAPCTCEEYAARAPGRVTKQLLHPFEHNTEIAPKMYRVSNAYAMGEFGIPVTEDGAILTDALIQERCGDYRETVIPHWIHRSEVTSLSGEYMMLYGRWSDGFWHWVNENIPTILMAEAAGYRGMYVVPQVKFVAESFQLLGIPLDRVAAYVGGSFHVEQLVIPIRPTGGQLIRLKGLLMELRSRLIFGAQATHGNSGRRMYISRAGVNRPRKVVNEEVIVQTIAKYGFQVIALEQLSFADQIRLTTQAEVLLGPHGAGMTHSLFMRPKSLVVEFFSPLYVNMTILPALTHLKHRYHMLTSYSFAGPFPHGENIHVCQDLLGLILDNELS